MALHRLQRIVNQVKRDVFRRGSPTFRIGVWSVGILGGLFLIYLDERKRNISERAIFLPARRQVVMDSSDIDQWNSSLAGGKSKLLRWDNDMPFDNENIKERISPKQATLSDDLENVRKDIRKQIAQEELDQLAAEARHKELMSREGWISRFLGLQVDPLNRSNHKKDSLFSLRGP